MKNYNERILNDCLIEYHKKFDDSEVDKIRERLQDIASERASFFQNLANNDAFDLKIQEVLEGYYRAFDDLVYNTSDAFNVFDSLRKNVKGLDKCNCCGKMGMLKPKLLQSMLGNLNSYISYLCEYCYNLKHLTVNSKIQITKDLEIPKGLTDIEVTIMKDIQSRLSK